MGIQGNLKTVTMPNLLQWLTQEPLTGTLVLRRGKVEKRIMLREGRILFTASNNPREFLTNYIQHMEWIRRDHPEIVGILKEYDQNPVVPLGRVLVERGVVTRDELARIITTKVQDSIIDLFFWVEGGFEFIEGEVAYDGIVDISIDVQWVMMEGARLMDELDRFQIVLSTPRLTFRVTDRMPRDDPRTDEIARMIESGTTLAEMCEALYPTDYPTYKMLFEWHEKGWIELGPEREAPPAKDAAHPLSVGDVVLCRHCGMATPSTVPYCEMCGSELVAEEPEATATDEAYHLIKGALFAGRYEIQEVVGLGEVGTVYAAHDRRHQETVTLRTLPSLPSEDPVVLDKLVGAGRSWRRLRHPNIVRVVDMGKAQGLFYLCLEHVEGARTLADPAVRHEVSASEESILDFATGVLEALTEAHAQGIAHGDIKAQNVLVDAEGHVRVADFCIANAFSGLTLSQRAEALGLPLYAAPEVLEGSGEADARSDVYSLGVLLYQLVTGDLPHVGETPEAIREHRERITPPSPRHRRPDLPLYLDAMIQRALAREPSARFETAGQMLREIQRGQRAARFRRNTRVAGAGLGVLALLMVALWFAAIRERLPSPKDLGNILQQADAYFASEQYIFPEKENAWALYRKVLKVDARNERALQGIEKIQSLFFERADRAVADGEIEAARIWLQKVKLVAADSERAKTLAGRLDEAQTKLEAEAQKAATVRKRLASAADALSQMELDPARTRQAFEDLKAVLQVDPGNAEAKKSWDGLMARLRDTAEKQAEAHSYVTARENFLLLASLNPDDASIQTRTSQIAALAEEAASRESRERDVAALLDAAERYLALGQVLSPAGASAADSYRRVLVMDPKNERARRGLDEIRRSFLARAEEAERRGELHRAREGLLSAKQAVADESESKAIDARLASVGEAITAQDEKQKRLQTVEGLLAKAKRQFEAGDLTTPAGANSLETYREVLRLDGDNLQAQAGLNDIQERLLVQGRREFDGKRYAVARDLFDRAASVRPGRADVVALAQQAGQALKAQAEEESRKEAIESWLDQGRRYLEAKQYFVPADANAFFAFGEVLKLEPENAEAKSKLAEIGKVFRAKGETAVGQKNYTEAKAAFESVLKVFPADAQATQKLAEVREVVDRRTRIEELLREADHHYRTRKYTQPAGGNALAAYRQVLELEPGNREATDRIASMKGMYVELARQSEQRGELPVSLDYLRKALLVDPGDRSLEPQISALDKKISAETTKALAAVRTPGAPQPAVTDRVGTPEGGRGAEGGGPAGPSGSTAVAGRGDVEDLLRRAAEALKQEKLVGDEGALRLLVRADGLAPGDARIRQDLSRARERVLAQARQEKDKGDLGKATGILIAAAQVDPGHEPTRLALDDVRRELDEREQKLERAKRLVQQATQQLRANELEEAVRGFQEALTLSPGSEEARRGLGDVKGAYVKLAEDSLAKGDPAQGKAMYGKALALDPNDATLKAKIQEVDGRIEKAAEEKKKEFRPAFSF